MSSALWRHTLAYTHFSVVVPRPTGTQNQATLCLTLRQEVETGDEGEEQEKREMETNIMMELIIHTGSVPESPTYYIFSDHNFSISQSAGFTFSLLWICLYCLRLFASSFFIPNLFPLHSFTSLLFNLLSRSLCACHHHLLPLPHLYLLSSV